MRFLYCLCFGFRFRFVEVFVFSFFVLNWVIRLRCFIRKEANDEGCRIGVVQAGKGHFTWA